jgi:AraC-like DNA-binding protein
VFSKCGLDPKLKDEPRARYALDDMQKAWEMSIELTGNPCLAIEVADVFSFTDYHVLGCAVGASSTLRKALERVSRYSRIVSESLQVALDDCGDQVRLVVADEDSAIPLLWRARTDMHLVGTTSACRTLFRDELNPVEVRLKHPEEGCGRKLENFFRCPVRFCCKRNEILFRREDVDRRLPAANREIAQATDEILRGFLDQLREQDFISAVKAAVADELTSGGPSDDEIAAALHMSPRTLQRRLAAKGTSFSELLDTVRRELAERYVADPSLSLSEISFLVGFSGPAAFSRAFKRWTGRTAREMRRISGR